MTSEIRLAFEHPHARSEAGAPEVADRISLRDQIVEVDIGAFQQERGKTQRVCFNVVVEVRPLNSVSDDVDRILSYDKVSEAISAELAKERLNLLETLAERIAERILLEPQALRVFVRIEKLDRGPGALGVEIVRSGNDIKLGSAPSAEEKVRPQIIFFSNEAVGSQNLPLWLDKLSYSDTPSVICVDLPKEGKSLTGHPMVDRRIALLSIEQNAWVLASKDDRCIVVGSKTELDWAIKHKKICVWAPSKMILDATEPPKGLISDTLGLAVWLGRSLNAIHVAAIGSFESGLDDPLILFSGIEADAL
tara:strand:- start:1264 stop:2184 length:921 start_codon:yes stop_codon:yes gene_type:complete